MNNSNNPLNIDDVTYISLTIPILIFFTYVPWLLQVIFTLSYKKTWNNVQPAVLHSIIKDEAKGGNEYAQRIVRCRSCHRNCFEDLIIWIFTVIFVYIFGVGRTYMLILTSFHFGARILYIFAYIFIARAGLSIIRSVLFWFGFISMAFIYWEVIVSYHIDWNYTT